MNFPSQIFFNDINHGNRAVMLKKTSLWLLPFYTAVATYCCYKKVRRMMCTAIVSYLVNKEIFNFKILLISLNIKPSRTFPQIGSTETRR